MPIDKFIKKILPFKYKRAVKEKLGVPSLYWSLQNLKKINFNPSTLLDIGAYEGYWTLDLLEVFPSAKVLMVEAQKISLPFLKKLSYSILILIMPFHYCHPGMGIKSIF